MVMQITPNGNLKLVCPTGLEPVRPYGQEILSLWRLPFRHGHPGRLGED